ncbi:MAG TPA: helix-turn-helix domain-containing protein [Anaerolineales bacterium]|nr:helix-turn-helix domain-containing protein [Anaerolineales bacterium]
MSKITQIDPIFTIADLETLKVVSDPLRMRIMDSIGLANQLGELRTVKQLAEDVDTPASKLYYHINLLEKHGLIKVADTQIVSGIIEKHYQITAYSITIDRELLSTGVGKDEKAEAVMSLLDSTLDAVRADMLRLVRAIMEDDVMEAKFSGKRGQISRENARLSPVQAKAFNERLLALMDEFRQISPPEGEDSNIYGLTIVFNPVLGDKLPVTNVQIEEPSNE